MRHSLPICVSFGFALIGIGFAGCEGNPSEQVVGAEAACTWERVECGPNMFGVKLDDPVPTWISVYELPGGYYIHAIRQEDETVDWESNIGIDQVSIKGGPDSGGHVYTYDPEQTAGKGLIAPINQATGKPYGVSHIEFCLDFELQVQKTALPSYTRTWDWTIDKRAAMGELTLSRDQVFTMPYDVQLTATSVDSEFKVAGEISIVNPWPVPAKVTAVEDVMPGMGSLSVACTPALPVVLGEAETIACTYATNLPDASARTNTANVIVDSTSEVKGASAQANVIFGEPTSVTDECVVVSDSRIEMPLGELCADDELLAFAYSMDLGPYACGNDQLFENTASLVTNDTKTLRSDSAVVSVDVPCPIGCTLTPGYWKTHSAYGPAPEDETWKLLADGPDTPFFSSGMSYYRVLWTPPKGGNAYFILARAYIAAKLNGLNGADTGSVASIFDEATQWFERIKQTTQLCAADRARLLWLASRLDEYNNGKVGPGHCSE
ncbi:MAG: hypothetical protein QM784_03645 [Polyangiaceae bacterium]